MKLKIAFGGIHIESSTFTSYISKMEDFIITRNSELLKRYPFLNNYKDIEPIPLVHARAMPGGIVSRKFFDEFTNELINRLSIIINELDALYLDLHGAMSVVGLEDAEGYLSEQIRKLNKDIIITSSMDLHGLVTNKLFKNVNLITCYKTAPHIDVIETRKRALDNLIEVINSKRKVYKVKVDVPILLSGEMTSTFVEPGKSLYLETLNSLKNKNIIDSSIWMGFPWADKNRSHAYILVTGYNKEECVLEANRLSKYFYSIKDKFTFVGKTLSLEESINEAINFEDNLFFISDTGDNPGAGGSGDLTIVLDKFINLNSNKNVLFASIRDKEVINKLYKNDIGSKVMIRLGSKIDPEYSNPIDIEVEIIKFSNDLIPKRIALVKYKNINIIITEERYQYGNISSYEKILDKDISIYDIIVVKMGYLEPDLNNIKKGWVMALTNGAVNQDLKSLNFKKLKEKLFPFNEIDLSDFKFHVNSF